MATYAKLVVFGPLAVSVISLVAIAVGTWLKHIGARYPEA